MADRIENKLKEIAKLNSKILEDIEKRLDAAGLKAAESAARWSSKLLNNVSNDPAINKMLGKVSAWGGKGGAAAASAFSKEFKKGVRDTTGSLNKLSGMMADVDRRMKSLSERKTAGWSKAAGVQREIMQAQKAVNEQIALNKRLMRTITYQAGQTQDSVEQKALRAKRKQLHLINEELEKSVDLSAKLGVQTRQVEVEEWIQNRLDKSFGWIGKMQDGGNKGMDIASHAFKGGNFKALGLPLLLAGVFEGLKAMVQEAIAAGKVFRESGQTGNQLAKSVGNAMDTSRDMLKKGLVVPAKEAAEAVGAVQDNLGELAVPRELSGDTAFITKMFKMSAGDAANLVTTLYRFNGRNEKEATNTLKKVYAFSQANGLNTNQVMRTMAEHAEDFAKAGNMSADAFMRAAADSKRIGYNMSSMTHLADSLVDDFEGALKKQAELSTMFPGMDMTETIYASQFGTQEQIADSVKNMINSSGYDINNMPRSFKNNLQKNTGLSATELANIAGSKDVSKFATASQQDEMNLSKQMLTQTFDLSAGGIGEVIKVLRTILFALGPLALVGKSIGWLTGERKTTPSEQTQFGVQKQAGEDTLNYSAAHMGKFHSGGVVGEPIPRFHTGLLNNEMLAVLEKGEAVLTQDMQTGVSALAGATGGSDMKRVESLLSELITAVKSQSNVIEMDGQKVGKVITKSYSRS